MDIPEPLFTNTTRRGREMEYLLEQFKAAHPESTGGGIEPHVVAECAVRNRLYNKPPVSPEERLRRELSRHLRGEYTHDPQGRSVRKHHAIIYIEDTADGPKRRSKWEEIFDAPKEHMQASLALRRKSALNDVVQLSIDFDSYNQNNRRGEVLPEMDFDFNKDIEESKMPTTYPDESPHTDEDDEPI